MFTDRINKAREEVRDLKTAKQIPSTVTAYTANKSVQFGTTPTTAVINYAAGEGEPITLFTSSSPLDYLRPYDSATQTQTIVIGKRANSGTTYIEIASTRPIDSIS